MFPKTQLLPGKQPRIIAEADQQVQLTMQALDKLCFKSSRNLGVGCPEIGMYFPKEMMLSQQKHIYPRCAESVIA